MKRLESEKSEKSKKVKKSKKSERVISISQTLQSSNSFLNLPEFESLAFRMELYFIYLLSFGPVVVISSAYSTLHNLR